MPDALPFNPHVLRWARTRSGLPVEAAAQRANTSADRVREWEDPGGNRRPTVPQARKLAALYGRPFLEFFAKRVPDVPPVELAPDFRFHRDPPSELELKALEEVHRWAEEQRLNALGLLELLGDKPPTLRADLHARTADDVDVVAEKIRNLIEFPIDTQFGLKSADRRLLPDILRGRFSACGVLILKQSGLKSARTRGICLYAEPLPIIVYGNEAPGAQAFTLVHEFAHVVIKKSAISGPVRFGRAATEGKQVESWCNRFAAAFLIPRNAVAALFEKPDAPLKAIDDLRLTDLANRFAVSRHAMLVRLVELEYVERNYYWRIKRPQFIADEENYKSPPMRAAYYGSRYRSSRGDFYTGLVLEAWGNGLISGHNAAEFMGIKNLQHLDDIRHKFRP